jgi:hypothetical protein
MMIIIYNVQFNKILTVAGGTSIASETCQTGSQNLHLRIAIIFEHKRFSYMIRGYSMRFRDAEQLLVWACCSYCGDTSCRTSCNSFCPNRCTGKDAISCNSQQPWCILQYHCRMNIPLITIPDSRFCDK